MSTTTRSPREIVADILANWSNPYFGAVPYLAALETLETWESYYGYDHAQSLGLYLLGNLQGFRGPEAKRLKAELKAATIR